MNYDPFDKIITGEEVRPAIPSSVYQPVKRCPNCQSVYLSDSSCEACGRSLLYHPVGEPFSAKSLYGHKERYYGSFSLLVKYFPVFENQTGVTAKSYVRKLLKRFDDLLEAFGTPDSISPKNRRLFYVETMELTDELLRYGVDPLLLQQKIEGNLLATGELLSQELLIYLSESQKSNKLSEHWKIQFLNHFIWGLRVEYILKVLMVAATVVAVAVGYYQVISSQVGK